LDGREYKAVLSSVSLIREKGYGEICESNEMALDKPIVLWRVMFGVPTFVGCREPVGLTQASVDGCFAT
jgi:hypothetical protein